LRPDCQPCRIAALDIPSRHRLVDRIAAATERRLVPWESVKRLARLAAVRGVIFASRKWLADFLGVSLRTLARIIDDLKRARVFVVLAARGAAGGTVMVPAWGREIDEPEAARAILRQLGQAVDEAAPSRWRARCCVGWCRTCYPRRRSGSCAGSPGECATNGR
jgi:sugar phosphate isomerase/epimerase